VDWCFTCISSWHSHGQLFTPALSKTLLDTGKRKIAKASPIDRISGIGLALSDPRALNKSSWRGHNFLGQTLMSVRSDLALAAAVRSDEKKQNNVSRLAQKTGLGVLVINGHKQSFISKKCQNARRKQE
jgi:hypothetical protein